MMRSTNTLVVLLLLVCLQVSIQAKEDSRFTQTLSEADRLGDTTEGKAYDKEFSKVVAPQLGDIVKGQLLEIDFTSNLNTDPKLKEEIDHIMDSVHLEE